MPKGLSRKSFIEELQFYLSFHFTDEEASDILNDYEEWFANEASAGKSEEEICRALTPPKKIVSNLLTESGNGSIKIPVLFQSTAVQVLLLVIMHLLMNLLLSKLCSSGSLSYLYFALGINFLYFIAGTVIIKKSRTPKPHNYGSNLSISGLAALIIVFEIFFLPKLQGPNSGKICVLMLTGVLFILFSTNVYFAVKKSISDKQFTFLTTLHICGLITLILFLINQLHALYSEASEFLNLIYGSLGIYAETVILCSVFYAKKIYEKESI